MGHFLLCILGGALVAASQPPHEKLWVSLARNLALMSGILIAVYTSR